MLLIIYETTLSSWGSKTEKLHLPILIEMDEGGYCIVSCPLFRGCRSYGEMIDEALENIREVIEMCLEETKVEMLNKFVGFRELEVSQNV
jgi:predicted RNase H-like HicB family nuclease